MFSVYIGNSLLAPAPEGGRMTAVRVMPCRMTRQQNLQITKRFTAKDGVLLEDLYVLCIETL